MAFSNISKIDHILQVEHMDKIFFYKIIFGERIWNLSLFFEFW